MSRSPLAPLGLAALAGALVLAGGTPAPAQSAADALRQDIEFAREKVYPALVNISCTVRMFSGGRSQRGPAAGSGVIVSPAGHVLTNFHVAGNTTRIICTLPTGEAIDSDVITHDPLTDLSVLKLRLETRKDPTQALPFAALGDSAALDVGSYVLAMGNPLSLSSSLTLGVVSNTGRVFTNFTGTDIEELDLGDGEVTGLFTRWLQHDALILPGNSGGPLVNLRGEVIGINELGGNGVGFAIPSNLAGKVLSHALTYGEVRRGWLGTTILPVGKMGREQGALVGSVVGGSPAELAGVQPGDIIRAMNGAPTDVRFFEQVPELYQRIAELEPGKPASLLVDRNGTHHELTVQVARMERFLGDEYEFRAHGITVRDITGPMALVRRYPNTDGVLVTGLRPGRSFEMARPRLRRGDVVTRIGDHTIKTAADFTAALEAVAEAEDVLVGHRRGEQELLTLFDPKQEEPKERGGELRKAWLGVRAQVLTTKIAEALKLPKKTRGFRVTQVFLGTEARKAGLLAGDIITSVDGEDLDAYRPRDSKELEIAIEELVIGEMADIGILRGGKTHTLKVKMQESPASISDVETARDETFEVSVRELVFMDLVRHRWPEGQEGLLVTETTMGGWANVGGLRSSDLLISINEEPVKTVKDFEALMAKVVDERPPVVTLFVRRGHRTAFVFIEPDWSSVPVKSEKQDK